MMKKINVWRYSEGEWQEFNPEDVGRGKQAYPVLSSSSTHKNDQNEYEDDARHNHHHPTSLRIAMYNVLFDTWKGRRYLPNVLLPQLRYRRQFEILRNLDADFIGLNEVTPTYLEALLKESWVQQQYYVSEALLPEAPTVVPFGNLFLSRSPIARLYTMPLSHTPRPAILACVRLGHPEGDEDDETESYFGVCTTHLTAPPGKHKIRKQQIEEIYWQLDRMNIRLDDVIIMGDMNLHKPFEDDIISHGFIDIWSHLRSDEDGFTYDADRNAMLKKMWPLAFKRMRLDRMLLRAESWNARSIKIFGTRPVSYCRVDGKHDDTDEDVLIDSLDEDSAMGKSSSDQTPLITRRRKQKKRSLLRQPWHLLLFFPKLLLLLCAFALDLVGVNIWWNHEKYLFPSDHFGLLTVLDRTADASRSTTTSTHGKGKERARD